ncbi:MAG: hypothetical protein KIT22_06515 [Verrucomicrobiae bacterium]|nr:hypothetical protein [Verrucomicrobiae bacterium]
MKEDVSKEFHRLRESLLIRKAEIEAELAILEAVLGGKAILEAALRVPVAATPPPEPPQEIRNSMSLGDAIFAATTAAPLGKVEILAAVEELGYRFAGGSSPIDEVGAVLQIDTRFEEVGGKYGRPWRLCFRRPDRGGRQRTNRRVVLMPTALLRKHRQDRGNRMKTPQQNTHFCDYFWNPAFVPIRKLPIFDGFQSVSGQSVPGGTPALPLLEGTVRPRKSGCDRATVRALFRP